ncbi:glyoxalase/bleomycin resistance/dioxygenase family protein [Natronococcus pandeyae]|uniref:Glyoxalase/bleomycin resistance/dioxygenase family protein n=1 Tax=Natronococcus pandeyae TaxID=2055836 RepID=A0A8J8TSC3_9EURY|nr:VOC family protein [Natronococcus pandeyae]TYL38634.1 glyoxalase/bleomycin resistance/dioxygenase family protein [Natronococcus pandeyae]
MASIGNITFACEDPDGLAAFWTAAVDYELQEAPPGLLEAIEAEGGDPNAAASAIDPDGHGPRLFFKKMPRSSPEHIPIHLDLNAADREEEVERLAELGASIVETKTETTGPYTEAWTVMRDPEGNGFCVQSPPEQ